MIPILYKSTETEFDNNGLGRLRDCISCKVTEERNGIYECDFEYPVTGKHYSDIQYGRIITAGHDYTGDVQPFDIVSVSRPINGIVTFHAVHVSYRQRFLVTKGTNINTIDGAFQMLQNSQPANPFNYGSDIITTAYMAAANGEPQTVKSLLGGVDGSILDTFGGEYEWDRFTVYLHLSRGIYKNFAIRYGVNLIDYNDEIDYSETYSAVIPYWKGTDENQNPIYVIGDRQSYPQATATGRGETIPVDLTDKFESQPTKVQVEAMATTYLNEQQPILPQRNISINFLRLQDSEEYARFEGLFDCKLCDSIRVIFPTYNMSGYFKIVKTEWDVLAERYKSMELGALPTTLSQALGLSK